ncbi:hypothetical protein BVC80_1175g60 [Macleaya cordata]|uniref:RNase H type-1 domain-containing protein n=1 Tax=Macleaya cordata TaxID=56857 RepID=A0A200QIG3_MACCD|nr:hypothetical protein BVC80_1175g60 [Macleaya cordata]
MPIIDDVADSIPITTWTPPAFDELKINVDGATTISHSAASAIARDHHGTFQGCGTRCTHPCLVEESEANGFVLGVDLAKRLHIRRCIIEGDSSNIVLYINGPEGKIPWRIRSIFLDIRDSIQHFDSLRFHHVRRTCNHVAHNLAKNALLFKVSGGLIFVHLIAL